MHQLSGVAGTTWFAVGYAATLLLVAFLIDLMARRTATSVERQRSGGFRYHADHDAWLCPEDQWLWPRSFDPDNRVMRYRASPTVCNACPVKDTCTTSAGGREVQRHVDPWPASESARFHRGIACTVAVLAVVWPVAGGLSAATSGRESRWTEVLLLGAVSLLVVLASLPLWAHLRRSPADPTGVLVRSSDDNVADRSELGTRQLARRTTYASDRRPMQAREGSGS